MGRYESSTLSIDYLQSYFMASNTETWQEPAWSWLSLKPCNQPLSTSQNSLEQWILRNMCSFHGTFLQLYVYNYSRYIHVAQIYTIRNSWSGDAKRRRKHPSNPGYLQKGKVALHMYMKTKLNGVGCFIQEPDIHWSPKVNLISEESLETIQRNGNTWLFFLWISSSVVVRRSKPKI